MRLVDHPLAIRTGVEHRCLEAIAALPLSGGWADRLHRFFAWLVAGPVLATFGAAPVLIGFAAVQTICMLGVAAVSLKARESEAEAEPALAA